MKKNYLLAAMAVISSHLYCQTDDSAWDLMNNLDPGGYTCVVDSLVYSFGGEWEGWTIGNAVNVYNTFTNEWSELTSLPIPWAEGTIGLIGNKVYLVGGWTGDWVTIDSIIEYDIAADTFAFKEEYQERIGSNAYCVMNDTIYLFGGLKDVSPNGNYPYNVFTCDPVNALWGSLPDMQYPHQMHGTAEVLDGNIYVLGGVGPGPDFTPQRSEKFDGEKWEPIAEIPVPVTLHKSIVHNNKILVFGGDSIWQPSQSYSTNLIQQYDPATDTWSLMEPMPFQRSALQGGKVGKYVYLMGGYIDDRNPSYSFVPEVWRFNLDYLTPVKVKINFKFPDISIYPNPTDKVLTIKTEQPDQYSIEITSLNGQQILMCEMEGTSHQIDISSFQNGIYFITIRSKDCVWSDKFIKL